MSYTYHERLSALDATFLTLEDENCHMHIGAVALFEAAPLRLPNGGVDFARIQGAVEAGIHRIPRYRQRLARIPIVDHPVWIDDQRFNLQYHLRHTNLPRPGDIRTLKRMVGRLMSQQLDRSKPLWEMWIVEGVEDDRFAVVTKVHHCMIDGVGSVELTGAVLRPTPEPDPHVVASPPRWVPRPAPRGYQLLSAEAARRAALPLAALGTIRSALAAPRAAAESVRNTLTGLRDALTAGFRFASPTPLNTDIGPHRRFDWTVMELDTVKEVRQRLGGTINDVVLAVLSGALRRFLRQRGLDARGLDFRAMIPVNVRGSEERTDLGNRVAMVVARLPLEERDARRRLERVIEETREIKGSSQVLGVKALEELSDRAFTTLFAQFGRLSAYAQPYNVVVTNVPGPQFPAYLLGARMLACYPLVPLFRNQALGVALFSYDGHLYWGFNADWDAVPDLHDLVEAVDTEFATMQAAAGLEAHVRPDHANGSAAPGPTTV